ncbi:LytR/AlgR family response regulator transcription factor [Anaerosporobacter sp.]|uniref:LytR/AlgR family response regulator transcription factor n=1 Tax=Anaerosporobacter sp. TaxID=1872529 RepID=UPI00286ED097|nr:LytTR family DNA-binding domain-containing protein [Anaerosporobacter sp.]
MLNIYLCEDNKIQRDMVTKFIENIVLIEDLDLNFICKTADPYEVLRVAEQQSDPGIYFLDVDLQAEINGLQLAQRIRKLDQRGFIVFLTALAGMATMTFTYRVEALDYIVKDKVGESDEVRARIHSCILEAYKRYTSPNNLSQPTYIVKTADREYCIALDDILYFETAETLHHLLVHTTTSILEFTGQMKEVEEQLGDRFYRCHRSFIVNCSHVKEIDLKEQIIYLDNGDTCFATRKSIRTFMERQKKK